MEDWALIRRLAAEEVPKTQIAERLGISRNTVTRAVASVEPPRYERVPVDATSFTPFEDRVPFEQDAANLVFQLVSSRYEHASLVLTSNLPFSSWGGVFGDQAVAAAMIDGVVQHADVLTLKGASYRLRNCGIHTLPGIDQPDT